VAVAITIGGVVVASAEAGQVKLERRLASGVLWGLAAMVLFGAFLFGVSYREHQLGWLAPIVLARAFTALFLAGYAGWRRVPLGWELSKGWPAARRAAAPVALIAALDTGGYVAFNVGVKHAATGIVATASAPYALVAALMAVWLLHERPTVQQRCGAVVVVSGLVLLGVAG
ncbi:MAG TPA: EamA family transporter, partial [Chloroflexota bacterium]